MTNKYFLHICTAELFSNLTLSHIDCAVILFEIVRCLGRQISVLDWQIPLVMDSCSWNVRHHVPYIILAVLLLSLCCSGVTGPYSHYLGDPYFSPRCTMQVDGVQWRLMVHNIALLRWSGVQHRFHKPTHTHTHKDSSNSMTLPADVGGKYNERT